MPTLPPRRKTILPCPALPPLFQRPSAKGLPTIVPPVAIVLNFALRMKSLSPDRSQYFFGMRFVLFLDAGASSTNGASSVNTTNSQIVRNRLFPLINGGPSRSTFTTEPRWLQTTVLVSPPWIWTLLAQVTPSTDTLKPLSLSPQQSPRLVTFTAAIFFGDPRSTCHQGLGCS